MKKIIYILSALVLIITLFISGCSSTPIGSPVQKTGEEVLDMLHECQFIASSPGQNCDFACNAINTKCIWETPIGTVQQGIPFHCSAAFEGQTSCVCCTK